MAYALLAIYTSPAAYLVMPLQNTIHGIVTETLDSLLSPFKEMDVAGPSRPRIIGDLRLRIRHCLVAKRGIKMRDIRWVRSHEQVSGRPFSQISERMHGAE